MNRTFLLRELARKAKKLRIDEVQFRRAAQELDEGKFDAILGGGVYKQRIARPGRGKSGGARTLVAFRQGDRTVFIDIFAKNALDNISAKALEATRQVAKSMFAVDLAGIDELVRCGLWIEVTDDVEG